MGALKIPQARMYWAKHTVVVPLVCESMKRDRFFEVRSNLHFVDDNDSIDKKDKLWKVRPMLDTVQKAFLELPKSNHLSIDEQMIPFSGKCVARQYVPSKPNPLGLKNFILASKDGLVLDFVIYQGKGTVPEDDVKTFGLGGAIVKRLVESIKNPNYQQVINTDRYFTGIKIAEYLLSKGIYSTGTVMSNRTQSGAQKFPSDNIMVRGDYVELCRSDDKMTLVKWKDKKTVLMLSTLCGIEPSDKCRRWSKPDNKKIDVPRPACVRLYNTYMGGIDLQDRFIALYRTNNYESHSSAEVLDYLKDNGVTLYFFPPHCSHKLQPLDRSVYGPLKKHVNTACDA
ncbi:piggyBac transposable element-derived protein 3-like [Uloborus diversus]|uniref:piggyBac transposable element-derived protein 3-like n=1 Tax=Uloborus diversus TaxID=327109 RepID=UPI002409C8EF|nr:piggyBac transposable element-derived protein 3-like [Uloborus diversus]